MWASENVRGPEIGVPQKEMLVRVFYLLQFHSNQPGPPPARIREGAELVRCREKEETSQPPTHMAGQDS